MSKIVNRIWISQMFCKVIYFWSVHSMLMALELLKGDSRDRAVFCRISGYFRNCLNAISL